MQFSAHCCTTGAVVPEVPMLPGRLRGAPSGGWRASAPVRGQAPRRRPGPGGTVPDTFSSRLIITGEKRMLSGCTHDLNKANFFADFIDPIRAWHAKFGGYIPDPHEVSIGE